MFGGMDWGKLMKQAKEMQKKMADIKEELKERIVEGTSGGGIVKVLMNGAGEVMDIKIEKEAINPEDKEMLEDLIIAAVNEAFAKSRKLVDQEMAKITGGFVPPDLLR
jgi:hypothetical protein